MNFTISGRLVDVWQKRIYPAAITVNNGKITGILPLPGAETAGLGYILPGFIDSHVHIESSMLVPGEFARLAVVHGTVATVSDPHEIANVCGMEGVEFMIADGKTVPFKFYFGAPSCVPATPFETAGAALHAAAVASLLAKDEIKYLSEMMNFPGVLFKDPEVMEKIAAAQASGKPVDGHAPALRGEQARQYIVAGISTDHECFTEEEALDKLQYGMKIIIREGSAARNFDALIGLLPRYPESILFCSDDKHPDSLVDGHINQLCARAVARGIDLFDVLQAACVNPVLHYKLDVGLLRTGDAADFIVVEDLQQFSVTGTYINGQRVAEDGRSLIQCQPSRIINNFTAQPVQPADFRVAWKGEQEIPVIEALEGQLITNKLSLAPTVKNGYIISNPAKDILKIAVINRYRPAPVAISFIRNFGLMHGAIASSVAHDSHNIVVVGVNDESISRAVNHIIERQGGVSCVATTTGGPPAEKVLALPIGGLMSNKDGYAVATAYTAIDRMAKSLGSQLDAPFMTLSFMALLVIPHLKLSDLGLFDGDEFRLVS
jgi:adenine deaminase